MNMQNARVIYRSLMKFLVELPRSRLPLAPTTKTYPLLGEDQSRFLIRAIDYEENKKTWKTAFELKAKSDDFVFRPVKIQITDLTAVYAVDI